jgi:hypothetical protein
LEQQNKKPFNGEGENSGSESDFYNDQRQEANARANVEMNEHQILLQMLKRRSRSQKTQRKNAVSMLLKRKAKRRPKQLFLSFSYRKSVLEPQTYSSSSYIKRVIHLPNLLVLQQIVLSIPLLLSRAPE